MARKKITRTLKKKATAKKPPKTSKKVAASSEPVSGIKPVSEISFVKIGGRATIYGDVLDRMKKLASTGKAGMGFEVEPGKVPLKTFSSRITSLLQRNPVTPPAGLRFAKRNTVGGKVAIYLAPSKPKSKK